MKKKTIVLTLSAVVMVGCITTGVILFTNHQHQVQAIEEKKQKKKIEASIRTTYAAMFSDPKQEVVRLDITRKEVNSFKKQLEKLSDTAAKKIYKKRMEAVEKFIDVRDKIRSYLPETILKMDVSDEQISELEQLFLGLEAGFQPLLQGDFDTMKAQRANIKELEQLMLGFFEGEVVKDQVNRTEFDHAKELINALPQKDFAASFQEKLTQVQARIDVLEAQARALIEAQRQAAIQAQIAESQRIAAENAKAAASNVIIQNIPMINQRLGVLNGCEGASLLMALQHFGYCGNMSLTDIAHAMPKSDNPHSGFIHDIFSAEPRNVVHWIAPDALAAFGSSYYSGVQNFSGASPAELRAEIDQGNPVVIYATYGFAPAKNYIGEVPLNLHVMLLIGYNSYTGAYILADPWGGIILNVAKNQFENSYNALQFAVAIRGGVKPVEPTPPPTVEGPTTEEDTVE